MWTETSNPIYGRTNNPFDCRKTVGGSSGGEGSIISACGSPIGIGLIIFFCIISKARIRQNIYAQKYQNMQDYQNMAQLIISVKIWLQTINNQYFAQFLIELLANYHQIDLMLIISCNIANGPL